MLKIEFLLFRRQGLDDPTRNAHDGSAGWNGFDDDGTGANSDAIAECDRSQDR